MVPLHFYHMNSTGSENKVSVILPLYNAESTIVKALESVLNQTYKNWELIIIDDGSTDKSVIYVQDFIQRLNAKIQKKITIRSQKNSGPSSARNHGIQQSNGEYIAFLDSDDSWIAEKLEIQIDYFKKNPTAGIVGGGFNQKIFEDHIKFRAVTYYQLLFRNYFLTPAVMIWRDALNAEKYVFDVSKTYCEDQDLWLRITHKHSGIYINQVLAKNIIGKANFGEKGLSSNLLLMYKGELSNYFSEYKNKRISYYSLLIILIFSFIKFCRRKWITNF